LPEKQKKNVEFHTSASPVILLGLLAYGIATVNYLSPLMQVICYFNFVLLLSLAGNIINRISNYIITTALTQSLL